MDLLRAFQALDGVAASLFVGGGFVAFALGATWFGRKLTRRLEIPPYPGSLTAVSSVIGTLVSILIGLVIVSLWQSFQVARTTVNNEAAQLRICWQLSELAGNRSASLRDELQGYVAALQRDEWPAMESGRGAESAGIALAALIRDGSASRTAGFDIRSNLLRLAELRSQRLSLTGSGVNWLLWLAIFVTPVFSLTAIALLNDTSTAFHFMLSLLAALAFGFAVFIAIELDLPFSGIAALGTDPIVAALR